MLKVRYLAAKYHFPERIPWIFRYVSTSNYLHKNQVYFPVFSLWKCLEGGILQWIPLYKMGRLADLRFLIRYVTVFLQSRFSYFRNELPETFEAEVDGLADLERNQRSFRSCKWTPPYFLLWAFFVRCTDSLPFVRTNLCYVTSPIFKPNSAHEAIFNCVNLKGIVSKYVPLSH